MQQQKETVAMEKLRVLMPQLGDMVRAVALANADWDVDQAVNMLRSFQVAHLDKVNMMNKASSVLQQCATAVCYSSVLQQCATSSIAENTFVRRTGQCFTHSSVF
jgi:hypothetical protein